MGHIELASPCAHIWYLKGIPSRMGLLLDVPPKQLDEVVYFVSHIVLNPGISKILKYREVLDERTARQEFIAVIKDIVDSNIIDEGSPDYTRAQDIISHLENHQNHLISLHLQLLFQSTQVLNLAWVLKLFKDC